MIYNVGPKSSCSSISNIKKLYNTTLNLFILFAESDTEEKSGLYPNKFIYFMSYLKCQHFLSTQLHLLYFSKLRNPTPESIQSLYLEKSRLNWAAITCMLKSGNNWLWQSCAEFFVRCLQFANPLENLFSCSYSQLIYQSGSGSSKFNAWPWSFYSPI